MLVLKSDGSLVRDSLEALNCALKQDTVYNPLLSTGSPGKTGICPFVTEKLLIGM